MAKGNITVLEFLGGPVGQFSCKFIIFLQDVSTAVLAVEWFVVIVVFPMKVGNFTPRTESNNFDYCRVACNCRCPFALLLLLQTINVVRQVLLHKKLGTLV